MRITKSICHAIVFTCLSATGAQAACPAVPEGLVIRSEFGDPTRHNIFVQGIWAIWYLPDAVSKEDVQLTSHQLDVARCTSINEFGMRDPANLKAGEYVNVYLHEPTVDDGFDDRWGNGVGYDLGDMAFMTLPLGGAHVEVANIDHEAFHVMQDTADSPGYENEGDSSWFSEASAEWYALHQQPDDLFAFLSMPSIAGMPHLSLWHSWDNGRSIDPSHWMTEARQYAMGAFLQYLVMNADLSQEAITSGFFNGTAKLPQEYLAQQIGHDAMAHAWVDFAALVTASFSDGTETPPPDWMMSEEQRDQGVDELDAILDDEPWINSQTEIAITVDLEAQNGMALTPPAAFLPRPWSYNVIALENAAGAVTATLSADKGGENLHLRLVTLVNDDWVIVPFTNGGSLNIEDASLAFLVVGYTPPIYFGTKSVRYEVQFDEIKHLQ